MSKKWLSPKPSHCEMCGKSFTSGSSFIDGRTAGGAWALMCTPCHLLSGGELGIGYGQEYDWLTCNLIKGDEDMPGDEIDRDDPLYDDGGAEDADGARGDFEPEDDRDED